MNREMERGRVCPRRRLPTSASRTPATPGASRQIALVAPSPAVAMLIRQECPIVREVTSPPRLALSFEGILHGNCAFPMRSRKA